jgi:cyclopropane fatty-acyl-phospholipid synthase-like methyltransferase
MANLKRPRLTNINPIETQLWILRRNESDIVRCYNFMTPYFRHATRGSTMLNFGYWSKKTEDPIQAQRELCALVGEFANLKSAENVLDVGSGFSAPAIQWKSIYNFLNISCVNINLLQLKTAKSIVNKNDSNDIVKSKKTTTTSQTLYVKNSADNNISLVNGTAKILPFKEKCMDRVIALESAQHFRPLIQFIQESKRILKYDGLLVMAIPVTTTITTANKSLSLAQQFKKLGILSLTWASEHYGLENIRSLFTEAGFKNVDIQNIGAHVYAPFTDYYVKNRRAIKNIILNGSQSSCSTPLLHNILYDVVENFIYKSALKMKEISQKGLIDYVLLRARLA